MQRQSDYIKLLIRSTAPALLGGARNSLLDAKTRQQNTGKNAESGGVAREAH